MEFSKAYYRSLAVQHIGCEKPRAYFIPFATQEEAKEELSVTAGRCDTSDYVKNLGGDWAFKWLPAADVIEDIEAAFADLPDSITVPSNWQMPLGKGYDVSCGLYHRSVTLTAELTMASLARMACLWMTVTYTVTGSGALTVDTHVKVTDREGFPYLPRLGMTWVMPEGHENLRWFSLGPDDSYEDKRLAARKGLFTATVSDSYKHPVFPHESGNHDGTEMASVTSLTGQGLRITAEKDFAFSAFHYSAEQLTAVAHDCDLVASPLTTLTVCYRQSGIGSNSCGPALAEAYRLKKKEWDFTFTVKPL